MALSFLNSIVLRLVYQRPELISIYDLLSSDWIWSRAKDMNCPDVATS